MTFYLTRSANKKDWQVVLDESRGVEYPRLERAMEAVALYIKEDLPLINRIRLIVEELPE